MLNLWRTFLNSFQPSVRATRHPRRRGLRRDWTASLTEHLEPRSMLSAATTTVLTASSLTLTYGQGDVLTATITSPAGTPSAGTVTFVDGQTSLGAAIVSHGTASLTVGAGVLGVGVHSITAEYSGDGANFSASNSSWVNTVAGTGIAGPVTNGVPGAVSQINDPVNPVVDSSGNVYFADFSNNQVLKIDSSGILHVVAGTGNYGDTGDGGQATAATFSHPTSVAIDEVNHFLYVAEYGGDSTSPGGNRIRQVDLTDGTITTFAGTGQRGYSGDNGPAISAAFGGDPIIATDSSGNVYVVDNQNNVVRKIDASSQHLITTIAGSGMPGYYGDGGVATSAELNYPAYLAFDPISGDLFIADEGNHIIRKINLATNVISTVAGTGTAGYNGDGLPATSELLNDPIGVGFDSYGNMFIGEYGNNRIREVNRSTEIMTTVVGNGLTAFAGDGIPATSAQLKSPYGVAVDSAGHVYTADNGHHRVVEAQIATEIGVLPAAPTILISAPGGNYTGNPFVASATSTGIDGTTPVNGTFSYRYSIGTVPTSAGTSIAPTSPGTYTVTATFVSSDPSYNNTSASKTFTINPAPPTVVSLDFGGDYTGQPYAASGWATGIGNVTVAGTYSATYYVGNSVSGPGSTTPPTNPGTYTVVGNFTSADPNYASGTSGPATFTIGQIPTTTSVSASQPVINQGQIEVLMASVSSSYGSPNGGTVTFYDGTTALGSATVSQGLAVLSLSTIVSGNHTITASYSGDGAKFAASATSTIQTVAGGGTDVNYPKGIAVDAAGDVFFTNPHLNIVCEVNAATHVISTVAGNGNFGFSGDGSAATSASLNYPQGIAVDAAGNLFIADTYNNRIREVNATTHVITTVAGNGNLGFSGDGSAATSAALGYPEGIALDAAGNLFIADSGNNKIREVDATTHVITTVAGNGIEGYAGDGSAAASASIAAPYGIAVDAAGDLFIADTYNHRIREVNAATQVITTVAGNGNSGFSGDGSAAALASLWFPRGIAVDATGNLFIADADNNRIREVNATTHVITTVAGNGGYSFSGDGSVATSASLALPYGIALDAAGDLFIADTENNRIREVNATTHVITTVAGNGSYSFSGDGSTATSASLDYPRGIAVDAAGNLFIADANNNRIREVNATTHVITTVAGNGFSGYSGDGSAATSASLNYPQGIAVDAAGNLFIADYGNSRIREVNATTHVITTVAGNGFSSYLGDGFAAMSASLNSPQSIAVDAAGDLFILDAGNNRIREVNAATHVITTVAGNGFSVFSGDGSAATSASLDSPQGIAVDAAGNLFIADTYNNRIREVNATTHVITTVAGNSGYGYTGDGSAATSTSLWYPSGITVDAAGNLFIADAENSRIREVNATTHMITTVAGNGSNGFSGDGSAATSASLYFPQTITVDAAGDLFIADLNSRVREVTASVSINVIPMAAIKGVSVGWGTSGSATLVDAANKTQLVATGRINDLPWFNINRLTITLDNSLSSLSPSDVSVIGSIGGNYGPVSVTGSGTSWTLTLAKPIATADKVSITIGNGLLNSYSRQLNVLPGDINDDGVVSSADVTLLNNATVSAYSLFADLNGDGIIDLNDVKLARTKLGSKRIL